MSRSLAGARWERSERFDARLAGLHEAAVAAVPSAAGRTALVAVGGYGRGEMSPCSDVDVVLLYTPDLPDGAVARLAEHLWYPLWDDGVSLDHAVRDTQTMREVAGSDWKAALGMLDARHVAGEFTLSRDLRSEVLADWRREARRRLPELRAACRRRADRAGDLAYAAVPDLKECRGGLRDGVVLRALVATWLVDVPHQQAEEHRSALLDVRDAVHAAAARRGDRLHPDLVPSVAALLGTDPESLGRHVRGLGRRNAHLVDLTWRRVDQALARPNRRPRRGPALQRLGDGLAVLGGEVVLDQPLGAAPGAAMDPFVALRAGAEAAERGLLLGPGTTARIAAATTTPLPWPDHARRALVRLLAAGAGLVPVWEELDHAGLVAHWLPEWDGVRLRASDSAVHRFTVDRHCVETCVEASRRLRDVARPDLLVVSALLHDIGKAMPGDHSVVGAAVAERVATRFGFGSSDAATIGFLVRHHLLLSWTAVRRDIDDPDTVAAVAAEVANGERLALLNALAESDARSTGPAAWTSWRAGLVRRLVAAVESSLSGSGVAADAGDSLPDRELQTPPDWATGVGVGLRMRVQPHSDGTRVSVAAPDRLGLLADVAGALAVSGLRIRAARAAVYGSAEPLSERAPVRPEITEGEARPQEATAIGAAPGAAPAAVAVSWWYVDSSEVDVARLRLRLDRVLDGSTDLRARLRPVPGTRAPATPTGAPPRVQVLAGVSATATVLQVRAADRPALLWHVCRSLADAGADVRSAHLETLGPQTEDVFYVTDRGGRPFGVEAAERLRSTVEHALGDRDADERR